MTTQHQHRCCQCRAGEHDNYDDDVRLVVVRDPDTGWIRLRGYCCANHRVAFADDGYKIDEVAP